MDSIITPHGEEELNTLEVVSPASWTGEQGCAVGPFSDEEVAQHCAENVIDADSLKNYHQRVFVKGDAWYITLLPKKPAIES